MILMIEMLSMACTKPHISPSPEHVSDRDVLIYRRFNLHAAALFPKDAEYLDM
jgi:hypothetical protein